jgi:hypothetical protein
MARGNTITLALISAVSTVLSAGIAAWSAVTVASQKATIVAVQRQVEETKQVAASAATLAQENQSRYAALLGEPDPTARAADAKPEPDGGPARAKGAAKVELPRAAAAAKPAARQAR